MLLRIMWLLLACPLALPISAAERASIRVLFVGNSHTYTHDVPRIVAALAAQRGVTLEAEMLAEPGLSLADHLAGPHLRHRLKRDWDWVVLQQGPSSLPESRADLVRSAEAIAAAVRGRPLRIALFSTWPQRAHRASSLAAEASYRIAALAIGACVVPAASAWRHALAADDPPALYQRDRMHATRAGAVLAALTILPGLVGAETSGLEALAADPAPGTPERIRQLQAAAWTAHRDEAANCDTRR
jgi:hypothetical protein